MELLHRLAHDFVHRGQTISDFLEAAPAKRKHSFLDGLVLQLDGGGALQNQLANFLAELEDFVETHPPLVTGVVAGAAAAPLEDFHVFRLFRRDAGFDERLRWNVELRLAVLANATNESLRTNEMNRGRHEKGLDAHVHQAIHGRGRVVRMQRRQHQVAGESGLDGDLGRLEVSNLTDEYDVRILSQE